MYIGELLFSSTRVSSQSLRMVASAFRTSATDMSVIALVMTLLDSSIFNIVFCTLKSDCTHYHFQTWTVLAQQTPPGGGGAQLLLLLFRK
jgi:hypothetical protein